MANALHDAGYRGAFACDEAVAPAAADWGV